MSEANNVDFEMSMAAKLDVLRDILPSGVVAGRATPRSAESEPFPVRQVDLSAPVIPLMTTTFTDQRPASMLESPIYDQPEGGDTAEEILHPFKLVKANRVPEESDEDQNTLGWQVTKDLSTLTEGINGALITIDNIEEIFTEAGKVDLELTFDLESSAVMSAMIVVNSIAPEIVMGPAPGDGIFTNNILIGVVEETTDPDSGARMGLSFKQYLNDALILKYDFYNGQIIRLAVPHQGNFGVA
jgi:hypothetical protein